MKKLAFLLASRWQAAAIALFLLWAHGAVVGYRAAEAPPGKKVIRIGHWQLEPGVRTALDEAARAYEKLHPDVRIVQDAIPEGTYGQWITCQLMGGTAPDILEVGIGLPSHVWIGYFQRYFLTLTPYVSEPNPYNRGTELEGKAWRQTFRDGMTGGYQEEIQEYVRIPLSVHGIRIVYNKDLLEKLTGQREAPGELRPWLEACRRIAAQNGPDGKPYVAIASSSYHFTRWDQIMFSPALFGLKGHADFNRDATLGIDELALGIATGRLDLSSPTFMSYLKLMREVSDQFQPGYTGLTRDEAVFLFSQQKAVFILGYSYDLGGLLEVAKDRFEVGVLQVPFPQKADPQLPGLVPGPNHEAANGAFPFSIVRSSKHPEIALDFLHYLSSQKVNERLNRTIGWIPNTLGAKMDGSLAAYEPQGAGIYGVPNGLSNFGISGDSLIRWRQLLSLYQIRQIDAPDLVQDFSAYLKQEFHKLRPERVANARREVAKRDRESAYLRGMALLRDGSADGDYWVRYRAALVSREILPELNGFVMQGIENGSIDTGRTPYGTVTVPGRGGKPAKEVIWPEVLK